MRSRLIIRPTLDDRFGDRVVLSTAMGPYNELEALATVLECMELYAALQPRGWSALPLDGCLRDLAFTLKCMELYRQERPTFVGSEHEILDFIKQHQELYHSLEDSSGLGIIGLLLRGEDHSQLKKLSRVGKLRRLQPP